FSLVHTIFRSVISSHPSSLFHFFFFTDPAPTEIYTLSLHDALPISRCGRAAGENRAGNRRPTARNCGNHEVADGANARGGITCLDRKSTRLNSSHVSISYAVFCLKKKKKKKKSIIKSRNIKSLITIR